MIVFWIVIALVVAAALIFILRRDDDLMPEEDAEDEALTKEISLPKEPSPIAEDDWLAEMFAEPQEPAPPPKKQKIAPPERRSAIQPWKETETRKGRIRPDFVFDRTAVYDLDQFAKTEKLKEPEKKPEPDLLEFEPINPEEYQREPAIILVLKVLCGFTCVVTLLFLLMAWYIYRQRNGL